MFKLNLSFGGLQRLFIGVSAINVSLLGLSYYSYKNGRPLYENMPPPNEEYRLSLYNLIAGDYDRIYGRNEEVTYINKYRKQIFKRAAGCVLELASGTGRNFDALIMNKFIKLLVCQDKSLNMCHVLQAKIENLRPPFPVVVIHHDAESPLWGTNIFDTIMCSFGISSFERPEAVLLEARRILKPSGRLLILDRGIPHSTLIRFFLKHLRLYPNPRVPWEFGYFEHLDIMELLKKLHFHIRNVHYKLLGTLYLISAGNVGKNVQSSEGIVNFKEEKLIGNMLNVTIQENEGMNNTEESMNNYLTNKLLDEILVIKESCETPFIYVYIP